MRASTNSTPDSAVLLRFPHSKDDLRRITVKDQTGEYDVYRLAPVISHWPASEVPDEVNPRSHDEECLKSPVAKHIEETLRNAPEDFWLANRGGYLLAERVKFDPQHSTVEITLSDPDIHGMADGATTNHVIAKLQKEWQEDKDPMLGESLATARFNLDVVVGLTDRDRIAKLVEGRNTSRQVRPWSISDFKGKFDWLKELIDREGGPFRNHIGWDENAGKAVTVLDLISYMLLFHPIYEDPAERRKRSPAIAFSSKGTNDKRLVDEKLAPGFKRMRAALEDILELHDYVYCRFHSVYEDFCQKYRGQQVARLATKRKKGFEKKDTRLPLTGEISEYRIDKGVVFPLLASLRCLLDFQHEPALWQVDPKSFFDEYGPDLMASLFEQYELCGNNPATVGKSRVVYVTLYNQARLLMAERQAAAGA